MTLKSWMTPSISRQSVAHSPLKACGRSGLEITTGGAVLVEAQHHAVARDQHDAWRSIPSKVEKGPGARDIGNGEAPVEARHRVPGPATAQAPTSPAPIVGHGVCNRRGHSKRQAHLFTQVAGLRRCRLHGLPPNQ